MEEIQDLGSEDGLKPRFVGKESSFHPEYSKWSRNERLEKMLQGIVEFQSSQGEEYIMLIEAGDVWQFPKRNESETKKLSFKVSSNQTSEKRILKISSGAYYFLSLDEDGNVWSWTDGSVNGFQQGQLGRGDNRTDYRELKMIEEGVLSNLRVSFLFCSFLSTQKP